MAQPRVEFYSDASGEVRWRFKAANGRIVATSGEGYSSKSKANAGFESMRKGVEIPGEFVIVHLDGARKG